MMILLSAAPLVLAGCPGHEHPGDSATSSANADEHPGEGDSGHNGSKGSGSSEHPGE